MKHREGNWVADGPAAENARRELCLYAEEYFSAGRKVARKGVSAERLHEFRLATKHFRYLLEMFQPLYGKRIDDLVKALRQVQTVLGELNDCSATAELLAEQAGVEDVRKLFQFLEDESRKKRREFRHLWKDQFDGPGEQERWQAVLERPLSRLPVKKNT